MNKHESLERRSRALPARRLGKAVYDAVKARILNGDYAPGERLAIEEFCQDFEVSRQPVMEAMRRLSGDWLVEIIPQVGSAVVDFEAGAISEFIVTFAQVESDVAALAAERRTPEQLARATSLSRQLAPLVEPTEEARLLARDYHRVVVEMAHSEILERLCQQMWDFAAFAANTVAPMNGDTMRRQGEVVLKLTQAIEDGDPESARRHTRVWLTGLHRPGVDGGSDRSA